MNDNVRGEWSVISGTIGASAKITTTPRITDEETARAFADSPLGVSTLEEEPKPSKLATVSKYAGKALAAAKWAWSIPFIKSMIGTRLAQAGIVGTIAIAVADKAFGG